MNSIIDQKRQDEEMNYGSCQAEMNRDDIKVSAAVHVGCLREDKTCTFFPRLEDYECDFKRKPDVNR